MRKSMMAMLLVVIAVVGSLAFIKYRSITKAIEDASKFAPPPDAVTSVVVKSEPWQRDLTVIGSVEPFQGVTLAIEEAGQVIDITFESGAVVNKGDVLVRINTQVEEANLRAAEARFILAKSNLKRAKELQLAKAMSAASLDSAEAELAQALGQIEALKATIAKKNIVAPFTGRTGVRQVNLGQYVSSGQPVVPLYALDPVYINFSVPQENLALATPGHSIKLNVTNYPDREFAGQITAVDPVLDRATRNLKVQATVANKEELLKPGMFARVTIVAPGNDHYITIPSSSVLFAPYGDSVFVVSMQKRSDGGEYLGVQQRMIKLGRTRGDQIAVLENLKEGEEIVTSGVFKLRSGGPVLINNAIKPENSAKPQVADT